MNHHIVTEEATPEAPTLPEAPVETPPEAPPVFVPAPVPLTPLAPQENPEGEPVPTRRRDPVHPYCPRNWDGFSFEF